MLKASALLCRSVLFREGLDPLRDAASSSIQVQYAACSVVKAFTANLHGIARVQQQQQQAANHRHVATAAAGGQGLVIDESAVRVSAVAGAALWAATQQPCGRACMGVRRQHGVAAHSTPCDMWLMQRLKELQAESAAGKDVKLRVEVEGGGCSGFQYKFRLDDSAAADDDV